MGERAFLCSAVRGSTHSETMSEDDNDTRGLPALLNPFDATDKHSSVNAVPDLRLGWHQRECPPRPPASSNPRLPAWIPLFPQSRVRETLASPPDRPTRDLTVRPRFLAMELAAKDDKVAQCPACRQDYDESSIARRAAPVLAGGAAQEEGRRGGSAGDNGTAPHDPAPNAAAIAAGKAAGADGGSRKHLFNVRVIQRNLVYVVGLNVQYCREDVLRRGDLFGRFGRIVKLQVSLPKPGDFQRQGSAYVTYHRREDAARCITGVDGTTLDGKVLRACFGTTKYCNAFLRYQQCSNPDCLYLHDMGSEDDLHQGGDARQVREQTRAIVPRRDQDWRKQRRQDEDPAGARERFDSGTARSHRERPSRAEDTIPFGGIAPSGAGALLLQAAAAAAANDGGSSWAGKIAPGQQQPLTGTRSGFSPRRRAGSRRPAPAPLGFGSSFLSLSSGAPHLQRGTRGPSPLAPRGAERLGRVRRPAREHG